MLLLFDIFWVPSHHLQKKYKLLHCCGSNLPSHSNISTQSNIYDYIFEYIIILKYEYDFQQTMVLTTAKLTMFDFLHSFIFKSYPAKSTANSVMPS